MRKNMSNLILRSKQLIKSTIYKLRGYYRNLPISYQTRIRIRGLVYRLSPRLFQIISSSRASTANNKKLTGNIQYIENSTQATIDAIKNIDLSKYDILSLDVFDTAIIRMCRSPDGVFDYIESRFHLPRFKKERINAENKSRAENKNRKDISIDEIYKNLDFDQDTEINSEMTLCIANPIIYDLYCRAKVLGKEVHFVSDMYLKKEQISNLLEKSGYDFDRLYVSSEDDLIKGDGSRFKKLKELFPDKKIIHVGDNELADFKWPKQLEIDSVKFHTPEDFFTSDRLLSHQYDKIILHESSGLQFLMGSYRFWKYGDRSKETSLWRDIGFFYGGPLVWEFANYIYEKVKNKKDTLGLFFLSRDGKIVKKVFDKLYGKKFSKTIYLMASRRAMTFPLFSIENKNVDMLNILRLYSVIDLQTTPKEVFGRIAYPELVQLLDDLEKINIKNRKLSEESIRLVLEKNQEQLARLAGEEMNCLISYLESVDFFNENDAVLVDVGWGGTIQNCVDIISDNRGYHKNIEGIYIGVTPNSQMAEKKQGMLFDRTNHQFYPDFEEFFDFIELLTSSPEKGVRRFNSSDERVEYEDDSSEENHRMNVSIEIQRGVLEFSEIAVRVGQDKIPSFGQEDFVHLFRVLRDHASENIISEFSKLRHSRMPSGSFVHPIIKFGG